MRNVSHALVLLAALLAVASPAWAEPVAVLAAVKGKVMLTSARAHTKPPVPARFGTTLERGDRLTVGAKSSATLFFNDGNILEAGEGSTMKISGRVSSGGVTGGDMLQKEAFGLVSKFTLRGSRDQGLVASPAMRSAGEVSGPEPLSPRNTDLLEATPTFTWRAAPGATRHVLRLSGTGGEVWTRESQASSLAWPADAAPLTDGEYVWDVQSFDVNGPAGKASSAFRLVPEVEARATRSIVTRIHQSAGGEDAPAARYLAGAYLCERGLLLAAAEEFMALARLTPDSPEPHLALGDVYDSMGLTDLASAAYMKARLLSPAR